MTHCSDFKFIDDFVHLLKVKNFLGYLAPFINNNKEVTWQILTVAAKFRVMEKFMKNAVSGDGTIQGSLSGAGETVPPKQDSSNLRHKFAYVLKQLYPSFEKKFILLILGNPDKLAHTTFIKTVGISVSLKTRMEIGKTIINLV